MNSGCFQKGCTPFNKKDWTKIDSIIQSRYPSEGSKIAEELGMTKCAIHLRASRIGVSFTGLRHLPKEQKEKISKGCTGIIKSPQWRNNLSIALKGRKHSQERIDAIINGIIKSRKEQRKMTTPEVVIQDILQYMFGKYNPFLFTGNRKFWIKLLSGKSRNPDFVYMQEKMIIEVFGRYWHRFENELDVIKSYNEIGWKCLVIWDDDININTRDIIMQFAFPYEYDEELRMEEVS